jgi:DNA-binding SARP family transcriptional activator/predicted negative regulator of RcsB-dependent stress response
MDDAAEPAFRVLGSLTVTIDGAPAALDRPRLRLLLALLVADAGRVVSVSSLVDGLWGERAPRDAERTVRTYVSVLRKALGDAPIVTRPPGYLLRTGPDTIDAGRFERLAAAGQRALAAGRPAAAAGSLTAALALWRGEAYAEFTEAASLRAEAARLDRVRLVAVQDRIEADLAAGGSAELVAELEELVAAHPGHERLWGQLMTALYRAGRQAEALETYRRARDGLIEQAGVEPTPALTEIHGRILDQDPGLRAGSWARAGAGFPTRPAQLPPALRAFTGRERELAELDAMLPAAGVVPAAPAVVAVSGTAGVGKTALVLRWAHRVADRFPAGQLYVNLRGYDPAGTATTATTAVRGFLDALGVAGERIPAGLDGQVALYRSMLAGRRVLVLLDNARDAAQVRPLLPGTVTAAVVVTSRDQLVPLVAADGAQPVPLDVLSDAEAEELFALRLGTARVTAEPAAVRELVSGCARLPLALAVVAARAATRPGEALATLAAELADARLDALDAGDATTDTRSVFSWSYRALSPGAARLFRLLGLHTGADISLPAAASLAGVPAAAAGPLLAELVRASLLTAVAPDRWECHDLLRAYAAELTQRTDSGPARRGAGDRLSDHYLHTAHAAARLFNPGGVAIRLPLPAPAPGSTPADLPDHRRAGEWLDTEHQALMAVAGQAERNGAHTRLWQLGWSLAIHLDRRGRWDDLVTIWTGVLAAGDAFDDPGARAYAHRTLGYINTIRDRPDEARGHLEQALDGFAAAGDTPAQARTRLSVADLEQSQGRPAEAIAHAEQAVLLYRAAERPDGEAAALNSLGWNHGQLGDHQAALRYCDQALSLLRRRPDPENEANVLDTLGHVHHQLGDLAAAADCYQRAVDLYQDLGVGLEHAATLARLGDTRHAAGDGQAARACWQRALDRYAELDSPAGDLLRARLGELLSSPGRSSTRTG